MGAGEIAKLAHIDLQYFRCGVTKLQAVCRKRLSKSNHALTLHNSTGSDDAKKTGANRFA
jgi:hypothetical protein